MESIQRLKEGLVQNNELAGLLDALKLIASSQFHALEKRKERFEKFSDAFEGFFHMIDFSSVDHPFARSSGNLGIIMVTSDAGFMGGLNNKVMTKALEYPGADDAKLIIIGERGASALTERKRTFKGFPGVTTEDRYEAALQLKDYVIQEGLAGSFGRLVLVYPKPISFTVQKIEIINILPCTELFEKRTDIIGDKESVIVESALDAIIEYLVEAWITQKFFEVLEDSKLAEFSARTVHLEESHQVLTERGKKLKFEYFRSMHSLIDKGMRESFSSQIIRNKERLHEKERL